MDIKHTLATAVTLLCLGTLQADAVDAHKYLAKEVLDNCKVSDAVQTDFGTDTIGGLKEIINWQLKTPSYDRELLLQQVKLRAGNDTSVYYGIETGISVKAGEEDKLKSRARTLETILRKTLNKIKLLNKLDYSRFSYRQAEQDSEKEMTILSELRQAIQQVETGAGQGNAHLGTIDFTNREQVRQAFSASQQLYSNEGILTFGLQGWNNLFGDHQGVRRGETVLLSALSHHYKSGQLRACFAQMLTFNKPTFLHLDEEGKPLKKKACGIHITVENPYLGELLEFTRYFKEQETDERYDNKNLSAEQQDEAVDYIMDKMTQNEIHGFIEQHNPTEFGYAELFALVEKYEDQGFEVQFITMDYVGRMSTKGCDQGANGQARKNLYERVQAFMLKKKIAFITAHQMSSEAKQLLRDGERLLVQAVCGLGYYMECRTLENEVDMEIYQALVTIGGKVFITWQRGKHRKPGAPTPEAMRFCVYPMTPVADVKWDLGKKAAYTNRLNGKADISEGDDEMFDN